MKSKKFDTSGVLKTEVKAMGLVKADVEHCLSSRYYTNSEAAHGNNRHLMLKHSHFSDKQIAVLVVLLKMPQQWVDPIAWSEVSLLAL